MKTIDQDHKELIGIIFPVIGAGLLEDKTCLNIANADHLDSEMLPIIFKP